MATVRDIKTRATAEAPSCCGKRMEFVGDANAGGPAPYRCGNCLTTAKGRRLEDICNDIDRGTLTPVDQKETAVNTTAPTAQAAEHNTAVMRRMLLDIRNDLRAGTDTINQLARRCNTTVGMVADAGEFAVATEQTDKSKGGLDETNALTTAMDQHLGGISAAVAAAEEAVDAALSALRTVDAAEDDLRQAGAGPKAAAPARADA